MEGTVEGPMTFPLGSLSCMRRVFEGFSIWFGRWREGRGREWCSRSWCSRNRMRVSAMEWCRADIERLREVVQVVRFE